MRGAKAAILRTAKTGRPAIRRAKRVVQPIVDEVLEDRSAVLGLAGLSRRDDFTYARSVKTCLIAVTVGERPAG